MIPFRQQILGVLNQAKNGQIALKLEFRILFNLLCEAAELDSLHLHGCLDRLAWGHRSWINAVKEGSKNLGEGKASPNWPEDFAFFTEEGLEYSRQQEA